MGFGFKVEGAEIRSLVSWSRLFLPNSINLSTVLEKNGGGVGQVRFEWNSLMLLLPVCDLKALFHFALDAFCYSILSYFEFDGL